MKFCSTIDMPMAVMSGARRNDSRNGRYATRSTVQPQTAVSTIAMMSTRRSASGTAVIPIVVSARNAIKAMNAPTMKTSPWAKLIMPMMP